MKALELESVIGMTTSSPFGLLVRESKILYPAGATLVEYDYTSNTQLNHITAPLAPKSISSLSKSSDGKYVAVGEVLF
jgi:hypothetical protein